MYRRRIIDWRKLAARPALTLLCLLAGCGAGVKVVDLYGPQPLYGVKPPGHDSGVQLLDVSYAPEGAVKWGASVIFTAHSNKTFYYGALNVQIGDGTYAGALLHDDGRAPDLAARDGEWAGQVDWRAQPGKAATLPVELELTWNDGTAGQKLKGDALNLLP